MGVVTNAMLFLKGRTMKTRKNLSHSHELTAAATVTAYDGWRDSVTITMRDDSKEGQDEISIEVPNNVFDKLVEKVNQIVREREESKMEESEVE